MFLMIEDDSPANTGAPHDQDGEWQPTFDLPKKATPPAIVTFTPSAPPVFCRKTKEGYEYGAHVLGDDRLEIIFGVKSSLTEATELARAITFADIDLRLQESSTNKRVCAKSKRVFSISEIRRPEQQLAQAKAA